MNLLWVSCASFAYVFLRAFQQLNVQHGAYYLVMPTSLLMALGDVFLITNYARDGVTTGLVLTVGVSAGLGSMGAMYLRKRFVR
jgi:hypothetical protein